MSKLRAVGDERRQTKRNSLADKLTVEAKAVASLKIEKDAVEHHPYPTPQRTAADVHRRLAG